MIEKDYDINFDELWKKLEDVCQKVWDDDKASAVMLQAVINEVEIGFKQAKELIVILRHELKMKDSASESEYNAKLITMEEKLNMSETRKNFFENEYEKVKEKNESLMNDLVIKEEENANFHEQYLKLGTEKDFEQSDHMEEFIKTTMEKDKKRQKFWEGRQNDLEINFKSREDELEKKYREMNSEISKSNAQAQGLYLQKEADLMEARKQFQLEFQNRETEMLKREQDYEQKYEELEKLKKDLRKEIAELTSQYEARTKDSPKNE